MKPRARSVLIGAGVGVGVYAISRYAFPNNLRGQTAVRVAPAIGAILRGLSAPKRAGDATNQILGVASIASLGLWFVRDAHTYAPQLPPGGARPAPSPSPPAQPPVHITEPTVPGSGMPAWEREALRAEQNFARDTWAQENRIDAGVYPSMYHAAARYLYDIGLSREIFADDVRGIEAFPTTMRDAIRGFQSHHQLQPTGYVNSSTYIRLKAVALPAEARL